MSQKKKGSSVPCNTDIRAVRLGLNPDIHRLLRMIAADDETSMSEWVRSLVEKTVREEVKRRGLK